MIRRLAAIMFTDMVGYTALMQVDEAEAQARRDRQRDVLEESIARHGGQVLQVYGDGVNVASRIQGLSVPGGSLTSVPPTGQPVVRSYSHDTEAYSEYLRGGSKWARRAHFRPPGRFLPPIELR